MIARPRSGILLMSAALLLGGTPGAAVAQLGSGRNAACGEVPLILLTWIKAPDRPQALKAITELRQSIRANISSKDLCPVTKEVSDAWLTRSGFPTDSMLLPRDARLLAGQVRADEFFDGEIKGFDFSGRIYLTRDNRAWLYEPVPKPEAAASLSQGAKFFVEKMKDVRKEFPHVQDCYHRLSDQKYAEAAAAAQLGIQAYPEATVARICLATAMEGQKKSPDERLAVISEVLRRDPRSPRALMLAITAYDEKGDKTGFQRAAGQFIAIDPGNSLVEGIVERLAQWKLTEEALKYIDIGLTEGDSTKNLLGLRFRLIYEGGKLKEAQQLGETLARRDTTVVDTQFVKRMFSAYAQDSQPERVLVWLKKGTEKFPENIGFTRGLAQQLTAMNRVPEALDVYKQLLKSHPETPEVRLRIANAYNGLGQSDSAVAWLREADKHKTPDEAPLIANVAARIAGKFVSDAQTSKSLDDYKKALPYIMFADSVSAGDNLAKFLWGASAYSIAGIQATSLEPNGTCETAKEAKSWTDVALDKIRSGGGKANAESAAKIMDGLMSSEGINGYLDKWITAHRCK